ncbi:hypothetical protein L083_1330 [Actinoplanes sp. N902-109]|nr:hypothetical protein L083_1330 [Actinoplanes sp. N902-109]
MQPIQFRRPHRNIDIRHTDTNDPIMKPSRRAGAVAVLSRYRTNANWWSNKERGSYSDRSAPRWR